MKVEWLGETNSNAEYTHCFGMNFRKGDPVDITDPELIAKAKQNKFFKVHDPPRRRTPQKSRHRTKH